MGFPGGTDGKEPACQCRRYERRRFNPWVGKIRGRRTQQPTRVLAWKNPMDGGAWRAYGPQGRTESDVTEATEHAALTHQHRLPLAQPGVGALS